MEQLNLPDLLLVAPKSTGNDALATFFDLLGYVAELGKPLPEGDTVGRAADERLPVTIGYKARRGNNLDSSTSIMLYRWLQSQR